MEKLKYEQYIPDNNFYGLLAITLIIIATIIQAFYGYARDADGVSKAIIAICCWGAVACSLMRVTTLKQYPVFARFLIISMLILVLWSISKTILLGKVYDGNKFLVLFGNMYGALNIIGVTFLFALSSLYDVRKLRKATCYFVVISTILLLLNFRTSIESYFLTYICAFAPLFIFYCNRVSRATILLGFVLSLMCFYGGGRQAAFFFIFSFASFISAKLLSKTWVYYISLAITILPFVFMFISLKYGSIFDLALSVIDDSSRTIQANSEEALNADNRTFLWIEFLQDFRKHDTITQCFGQGAVAYYDSTFFKTFHRLGIEVPVLQWVMQVGILYLLLFSTLVFYTIYRLYKNGENEICKTASILIAAFFFEEFVCNTNGCSIMQFGVWFMFSIAYNKELLYIDDQSLYEVLSDDVDYTYEEQKNDNDEDIIDITQ